MTLSQGISNPAAISFLIGGRRQWWDVGSGQFVDTLVLYVAYGCPDWGTRRNPETGQEQRLEGRCTFCGLPGAVASFEKDFFEGQRISPESHVALFEKTLQGAIREGGEPHTLMIFNAGSFLAMHPFVQEGVLHTLVKYSDIRRIVIEARAPLITKPRVTRLMDILSPREVQLTIRIGIESQNDSLRNDVLGKGQERGALLKAIAVMKEHGIQSGGYALLNPAPQLDPNWARQEAIETIRWILGKGDGRLGMDEVYFGPTCVAPETKLARLWSNGEFNPIDLWSILFVLQQVLPEYRGRVHLLPFVDVPAFVAVPSNHVPAGIPETLEGAKGCDVEFHRMFALFRKTMDPGVLRPPECACRPEWFVEL